MAPKKSKKGGDEGNKKEPKLWVLEPDDELRELMKAALEATGEDRSAIMIECIREELPDVVRRILGERKAAEEKFLSTLASKKPKQSTDK